eukprot:6371368-Pyramimonas_sp.AAC.1
MSQEGGCLPAGAWRGARRHLADGPAHGRIGDGRLSTQNGFLHGPPVGEEDVAVLRHPRGRATPQGGGAHCARVASAAPSAPSPQS